MRDHQPTGGPWVPITGRDVWKAVKEGAGLSFFTSHFCWMLTTFGRDGHIDWKLYCLVQLGCVVAGTLLFLPFNLLVVATARRRGFFPALLRFIDVAVVTVGMLAMVCVFGVRLIAALVEVSR